MTDFSSLTAIVVELTDHGLPEILSSLGVRVLTADCAAQALRLKDRHMIDLAFVDVLLPGGGERLLQEMQRRHNGLRPCCALTCVCGFPADDTAYPLLTRPYSADDVEKLLPLMLRQACAIDDAQSRRIDGLLTRLGVPQHPGKTYLRIAIGMTCHDNRLPGLLSKRLYPAIAAQHNTTPAKVERAIRHCIDAAWKLGSVEEQYRLFGNTIDAQRGKPTVGQMIARSADILRLEEFL